MKYLYLCFVGLAALTRSFGQNAEFPEAFIEVTTQDEFGGALSGVQIIGVFALPIKSVSETVAVRKTTDLKGYAVVRSRTNGNCSVETKFQGYYRSWAVTDFDDRENDRWLPSPRKELLIMKKIGTPVPMYAISGWTVSLPGPDGSFGFDLEKLDWVTPHGAGIVSDLIFTQEKKIDNVLGSSATLRISFSNRGDGIIPLYELKGGSELHLPRTAPMEGYEAERQLTTDWTLHREHKPRAKPALGYLYRVRTVLDENGRVKSAWYGKIDGEFNWDPKNFPTGEVIFTYYLNPDGTTNLEFDRKRNLFGELPVENTVHRP
jgi:hypothetical protein